MNHLIVQSVTWHLKPRHLLNLMCTCKAVKECILQNEAYWARVCFHLLWRNLGLWYGKEGMEVAFDYTDYFMVFNDYNKAMEGFREKLLQSKTRSSEVQECLDFLRESTSYAENARYYLWQSLRGDWACSTGRLSNEECTLHPIVPMTYIIKHELYHINECKVRSLLYKLDEYNINAKKEMFEIMTRDLGSGIRYSYSYQDQLLIDRGRSMVIRGFAENNRFWYCGFLWRDYR
jgi:hypothetical protein